jgi:hypothetical protein
VTRAICAVLMLATLAGCSRVASSPINPLNWFGRSKESAPVAAPASQPAANRVAQVLSLRAEPVPGGAILRATGLPQRQGYFDGRLVQLTSQDAGVMSFEFRIEQPFMQTNVGPQVSREVIVGTFLSEQQLAGVRLIQVSGATNALSIRR